MSDKVPSQSIPLNSFQGQEFVGLVRNYIISSSTVLCNGFLLFAYLQPVLLLPSSHLLCPVITPQDSATTRPLVYPSPPNSQNPQANQEKFHSKWVKHSCASMCFVPIFGAEERSHKQTVVIKSHSLDIRYLLSFQSSKVSIIGFIFPR